MWLDLGSVESVEAEDSLYVEKKRLSLYFINISRGSGYLGCYTL